MANMARLIAEYGVAVVNTLPPWMVRNPDIAAAYLTEMIDVQGGTSNPSSAANALETIRLAPEYRGMYDSAFPGLRREDGSLRMEEGSYYAEIQDMRSYVQSVGIDPTVFENRYGQLVGGDVSASEFGQRVNALHAAVILNAPEVSTWYSENYKLDMSPAAILGSLMDPELGDSLINQRITSAQIGGAAAQRGFNVDLAFAELYGASDRLDTQGEAENFFGEAASLIPVLSVLASRHADPDDEFDLQDFASASIFDDPDERRRINRLIAQERSMFTSGARTGYTASQDGSVVGLRQS